jgi:competence protein ComFC
VLDAAVSLYAYNEAMKAYLRQYKFLKDAALASVFSDAIRKADILKGRTAVPIPMHPERLKERTFPQVEELLVQANIPYVQLLEKTTAKNLGGMGRKERMASGPLFRLSDGAKVSPVDYVLVDDLYTTGTTLHHAALLLRNSGARSVAALTLIRA